MKKQSRAFSEDARQMLDFDMRTLAQSFEIETALEKMRFILVHLSLMRRQSKKV